MSLNKILLIGNLGKDVELRYTPAGVAVATFSIATTEKYTDKGGNKQEKTEWHNIVVWRQLAEICAKYLQKGSQVYIEGKITTRSYDDRDGNKRYVTEIIADQMKMLGAKGDAKPRETAAPPAQTRAQESANHPPQYDDADPPFNPDEDIPF